MSKPVILITGASSGLGRLVAIDLCSRGNLVYAGYRNNDPDLKNNENLKWIRLDVKDPKRIRQVMADIYKKHKKIDVLINNAGLSRVGAIEQVSEEDTREMMEVNFFGPYITISEAIKFMRKKKSGKIINISSLSGLVPFPNHSSYSSSKSALHVFSESLSVETATDGIQIIEVAPGAIKSSSPAPKNAAREKIPLLKLLLPLVKPEDVVREVNKIVQGVSLGNLILVGRDAKIIFLLYKFLPRSIWSIFQSYIWNRQK